MRRVDWDSDSWGGTVHHDSHGSWLASAHGEEQDQ